MRMIALGLILSAVIAVFFVGELKPSGPGAFLFFSIWLLIPYAGMAAMFVHLQRSGRSALPWHAAMLMIAVGGVLFLTDTVFWHPDAQGGIAVLMTPIFQAAAMAFLAPVCWWMSRRAGT